jgi:hypothetical protein
MKNYFYYFIVLFSSFQSFALVVIRHSKTSELEWSQYLQDHPDSISFSLYYQSVNSSLTDSQLILLDQLKATRIQKDALGENEVRLELLSSLESTIWNESIRQLLINIWSTSDIEQIQLFSNFSNLISKSNEKSNSEINQKLTDELFNVSGTLFVNGWAVSKNDLHRIQFSSDRYYQIVILSDISTPLLFSGYARDFKLPEIQPIVSGDCYSPKWNPQMSWKSALAIFPNHCTSPFLGNQISVSTEIEKTSLENPFGSQKSNEEDTHQSTVRAVPQWIWYAAAAIAAGYLVSDLTKQYQIELSLQN